MSKRIDMTGIQIGQLTVLRYDHTNSSGRALWECQCSCGNKTLVAAPLLRTGHTKSCGCLKNASRPKHGGSTSRLYRIWHNMKQRCNNESLPCANDYSSRGISVCAEWEHDFAAFQAWALANGYRDDLTIDRIDVNGNYEPNNCRWATRIEQANNMRRNAFITFNGKSQQLDEWAVETGIKRSTLANRLYVLGWSVERTLTEPTHRKAGRK